MTSPTHYPLAWPEGQARTRQRQRGSPFKVSLARAVGDLQDALRLFGQDTGQAVRNVVISSNVTLGHARGMASATGDGTARAAGATKPVPRAAIEAVGDPLRQAGSETDPGVAGGEVSLLRPRILNEVLKAQTARVRLAKMKGELVDRARATAVVFDLARRERDAWMNWPPRVAANMAAELGVEPHRMEQVLEKHLCEHLAELAEVKIELR